MRSELKVPLGKLIKGEPREVIIDFKKLICCKKPKMFATVGDYVSKNIVEAGLKPDIVVVDYRIMRLEIKQTKYECRHEIHTRNPRGTIEADVWNAIEKAVMFKRKVSVIVEGEEDLLVLPLIAIMPTGSLIVYGQPRIGLVVVEVTEERKEWADDFMNRMKENRNGDKVNDDQGQPAS